MAELEVNAVLRKTESGQSAIKLRDRTLTPKHRMLLIMVDGSKTVADLSDPMPEPAQVRQALAELLSAGLVAPADLAQAVFKAAPELAPVASEVPTVSLKVAIQRATRMLENLLGPTCEPLSLQLEQCQSLDQFTRKVQDFRRVVAAMRSEKKATEFVAAALGV